MALRRRKILKRRLNSHQLENVDGNGRDQARSPSSLSNLVVIMDIPKQPASNASSSMVSIDCISASVGLASLVARSIPIAATRISE